MSKDHAGGKRDPERLQEATGTPFADEASAVAKAPPPLHADHRQRLRERFLKSDTDAFPDYELLELLLFYSIDRVDVKPLAKELLRDFGSLRSILAAEPARLLQYKRVNERTLALFKALKETGRRLSRAEIEDRPLISSWDALVTYCRLTLADESIERFHVLYLNRKNRLIADEQQQRGTVDHTPVYPREVVKRALELGATAVILVHNHPSGDPTPSQADIDMTRTIKEAAEIIGISVYDHIIVGRTGAQSLRTLGLL
ncbi:MAG: DNA repair protein RadC [Defluviicoccus sp.]